jgi:hypothetical protein
MGQGVTGRQLFWTTFLMMFPTIILLLPGELLRLGGRYAWWTPVVAALPTVALNGLVGAGAGRRGALAPAARRALGPLLGRLPLLGVWVALGAYAVVVTREFAQIALATFVFADVPIWVLTLMGLTVAVLAAWLGIAVIARGAEVFGPLLIAVYMGLLAAALPFSHGIWALPLLPRNGRFAAWQPLADTWVWLAEPLAATLMLERVAPSCRRRAGWALAAATACAAVLTAIGLWVTVADFGPARAAEFVLPFVGLAEGITFGTFLQHFELLLIPVVLMGGAGKMAVFYWLFSCAGEGLTGGGRPAWLLAGALGLGLTSILALSSVVALEGALTTVLASRALPLLVGAVTVVYGVAALRPAGASR